MNVLILNPSSYSESHIIKIKKFFNNVHLKNFKNKNDLIIFLKKCKKQKNPIKVLFTSFGIFYDKEIFQYLAKNSYLISTTTSVTHIDRANIGKNTSLIYLDKRIFGEDLKKVPSTAEHTVALILALYRNLYPAIKSVKEKKWNRENFKGEELFNKKIGIIGFGRIGKIVAKIMNAFGVKVFYYKKKKINEKKYKKTTLKYIFSNCDIISIHLDSRKKNFKFIKKKHISLMKKTSILINTSRGELIDENALIKALKDKKISGAALDVLEDDSSWGSKIQNNKVIKFSSNNHRLIITPHIGGNTHEASLKTKDLIINELLNKIKYA